MVSFIGNVSASFCLSALASIAFWQFRFLQLLWVTELRSGHPTVLTFSARSHSDSSPFLKILEHIFNYFVENFRDVLIQLEPE